jgi:very-short-patch-repair endonuclease
MSKFIVYCSCIICRKQTTVQSLSAHIKSHDQKVPTNKCLQCGTLSFNDKFCSNACSATYNNNQRDYTKFKPGPKKSNIKKPRKPVKQTEKRCSVCDVTFTSGIRKTCSAQCRKTLALKTKLANGWNPNRNRGRHKKSYLEQSFEDYLKLNSVKFESEYTMHRKDRIQWYFLDFYFPELKLIIELDGSHHLSDEAKAKDLDRDTYILKNYGIYTLRISHKEYKNKSKIHIVDELLSINSWSGEGESNSML